MHCPASGIRGTVYPVVYGKSEIFKLFLGMSPEGWGVTALSLKIAT